jgi:uncharacterized protein
MDFTGARDYILRRLENELYAGLYYHSLDHTLDVETSSARLAQMENVDTHTTILIRTAALYHDSGMIYNYRDHEEASCKLVREVLPDYGYTEDEIRQICKMILVTKLPQRTNSLAEKIICDADLDPLGRDDFLISSFKLRLEWEVNGIRQYSLKDWIRMQIEFLESHTYFTKSQIRLRQERKIRNLEELKGLLNP